MSEYRFEAELAFEDAVPAAVVRQRAYGAVRVTAEWPDDLTRTPARVALTVTGDLAPRDAPAYAELFFHDVFLLLNLAVPGSFGGTISIRGGELRVRALRFDARVFAYAASRTTVPLEDVVRWYDGLNLGTQQLATSGAAVALLQLLHLARSKEREDESILRLAIAAGAVVEKTKVPPRLFELRDDIAQGRTPIFHPMHDDALDERVEDATREWIEVADAAAGLVIGALQEQAKRA